MGARALCVIMERKILILDLQIILSVFFLSWFWEFYFDDPLFGLLYGMNYTEALAMKWHIVFLNVFFASISVIIPSWFFVALQKKQRKLEEDIKAFQKFAEFSGQGFVISGLDGVITFANQAFGHMIKEPGQNEIVGKQILDYYPDVQRKRLENEILPVVTEKRQWTGESSLLSCDGKEIAVIDSIFHVYDEDGKPCYLARMITDITSQKESERMIKLFQRKLIKTQESERSRIASELHDSLAQNLLVIKNEIERGIQERRGENGTVDPLARARSLTMETLDEINEIAYKLRPPYLDKMGFEKAIKRMIEKISKSMGINIFTEINRVENPLPKDLEMNVYRIIQEALNNIMKHSGAGEVYIDIADNGACVEIHISDDGRGFDSSAITSREQSETSRGLLGIKERVNIYDGSFLIDSDKGEGSTLTIFLPYSKTAGD
ncbi:hypothetical protein MNBD_NITROSPINAE02-435 [hydrothermal vent metagenome]|uniref:Oxygen sensor histidine kinase NreB n=1 Tax=hydrothermal vent metagenome TaxID=652676 RepID=A0A3B1CPP3_9ZZZZ